MKKYTVTATEGRKVTIRANFAPHAAHLAGVLWYSPHPLRVQGVQGAPNTEHSGVYDLIDPVMGDIIDRVTITPYAPAQSVPRAAGVVHPVSLHSMRLDEPTVTTLRALGDGNLSLGVRRAAALIGGGA